MGARCIPIQAKSSVLRSDEGPLEEPPYVDERSLLTSAPTEPAPTSLLMGLTIHYTLIAPAGTDAARAREIVMQLRRRAQGSFSP